MLADYELSSCSFSSAGSANVRMYYVDRRFSEPLYDHLYLENTRITTIAERKKAIFITHSRTLAEDRSSRSRSIDELHKSRYKARQKFFQDLEHQQETRLATSPESVRANRGEGDCKRDSTKKPERSEEMYLRPAKVDDAPLATKSPEKQNGQVSDERRGSSDVTVYPVQWKNIVEASSVEVVNVNETEQNSHNIVTSCASSNNQVEEETGYHDSSTEEIVCTTSVLLEEPSSTAAATENKEEDDVAANLTFDANNKEQCVATTVANIMRAEGATPACCDRNEAFQEDDNDEEENALPLNRVSPDAYSDKFPASYGECYDDEMTDIGEESPNEETGDNVASKEPNIRSSIESSTYESDHSHGEETSSPESCHDNLMLAIKDADEPESYYDDLVKMVENIDTNISTSKTELDALPNTDTCVKYNLNSTSMNLIYSLTPSIAIDQEDSDDDTSQDLAERSSDWQSDATKSNGSDVLGEYIWMEPAAEYAKPVDRPSDAASDSSSNCSDPEKLEQEQPELKRHSISSGSDILELPSGTILELSDIDGEVFHNGINESTNEIIADLNASDEMMRHDSLQIASCVVAEVVKNVYVLSYLDSSIHDLKVLRDVVCQLLDNYRYEFLLLTEKAPLLDEARTSSEGLKMKPTADEDNDDDICQIKGFLSHSSPNSHHDDQDEREDQTSAVIEFCTVAKRLPIIIEDETVQLNFHVMKVPTDVNANERLDISVIDDAEDNATRDVDQDPLICKCSNKKNYNENAVMMKSDVEMCHDCSYCCEQEDSLTEQSRLTPINEEPDESSCEQHDYSASIFLENSNNDSSCQLEVVEENAENPTRKIMSLDDTYTISEYSDNDERNDPQERDIWDSLVDCMSCSYDTKEFMLLEKAVVENSRSNA